LSIAAPGSEVLMDYVIALAASIVLFVYLVYALLRPEQF
jgi:K+-transporting ATPase KdpF subunit